MSRPTPVFVEKLLKGLLPDILVTLETECVEECYSSFEPCRYWLTQCPLHLRPQPETGESIAQIWIAIREAAISREVQLQVCLTLQNGVNGQEHQNATDQPNGSLNEGDSLDEDRPAEMVYVEEYEDTGEEAEDGCEEDEDGGEECENNKEEHDQTAGNIKQSSAHPQGSSSQPVQNPVMAAKDTLKHTQVVHTGFQGTLERCEQTATTKKWQGIWWKSEKVKRASPIYLIHPMYSTHPAPTRPFSFTRHSPFTPWMYYQGASSSTSFTRLHTYPLHPSPALKSTNKVVIIWMLHTMSLWESITGFQGLAVLDHGYTAAMEHNCSFQVHAPNPNLDQALRSAFTLYQDWLCKLCGRARSQVGQGVMLDFCIGIPLSSRIHQMDVRRQGSRHMCAGGMWCGKGMMI